MSKKILLIEDDLGLAKRIKFHIEIRFENAVDVIIASNFYEASKEINSDTVDMIISDLQMPSKGLCEQFTHSQGTTLNGWHFLCDLLSENNASILNIINKGNVAFFSAYLERLKEEVEGDIQKQGWLDKITILNKGYVLRGVGGLHGLIVIIQDKLNLGRS